MLEVSAKLIGSTVYLGGECVECLITFSYPVEPQHKVAQGHHDQHEGLAWASAQIQCHCFTDSKIAKIPTTKPQVAVADTALSAIAGENGHLVFSTKPKILFCDLRLTPGQIKTYFYKEKIPLDSPPSYRGQLVKYSYKLTVGTQRVNSPVKLLRVPLRVLPLPLEAVLSEGGALCNETTEELTPANPFLEVRQKELPVDLALQGLQNITARRNPNFYMISNTWGRVARFCLFKPAYKLGEDIIGTFDFTLGTVKCMQVSVSLQCEEETILEVKSDTKQRRIVTFSKHHEVCLGYQYTQLILPIPLHITPAFQTDLVSLKWRLHFEFVTSTNEELNVPSLDEIDGGEAWRAPHQVPIETMVWSLPIRLYSTSPHHIVQQATAHANCSIQKLFIR